MLRLDGRVVGRTCWAAVNRLSWDQTFCIQLERVSEAATVYSTSDRIKSHDSQTVMWAVKEKFQTNTCFKSFYKSSETLFTTGAENLKAVCHLIKNSTTSSRLFAVPSPINSEFFPLCLKNLQICKWREKWSAIIFQVLFIKQFFQGVFCQHPAWFFFEQFGPSIKTLAGSAEAP